MDVADFQPSPVEIKATRDLIRSKGAVFEQLQSMLLGVAHGDLALAPATTAE